MEFTNLQKKIIEAAMNLPIMDEITEELKDYHKIDISYDDLDEEMSNIIGIVS